MLKVRYTTSELEGDDFVGLRFENNQPKVVFPRGYALADSDDEVRKDIIRLLSTILKYKDKYQGEEIRASIGEQYLSFPLLSYQYIIQDFLAHGYYIEKEVQYAEATKGKISWKRTIQQQRPQIDGNNAVYLSFIVRQNKINDNNLITRIHEYCVYESFRNLGWLYTPAMPKKPTITFNKKAFIATLTNELRNTNDDGKKKLFSCMINIINEADELFNSSQRKAFGVDRFEYIWEALIDHVFGEDDKEVFFPHSTWEIIDSTGVKRINPPLEPDTIIRYNGAIFVVDAKYYKYGVTFNPEHLPGTSSIQKQITYGEYIERKFKTDQVYNAFVMPFNKQNGVSNYRLVSIGTADWKDNSDKNYEFVLGILLDTRHIINTYARQNPSEIEELSSLIIESLAQYRRTK